MLARAGTERLAFHYARLKSGFAEVKKSLGNDKLSEIECFAACLKDHLSNSGDRIVDKAVERWKSLRELSDQVLKKVNAAGNKGVEFEADVLRGIIDFEVERNRDSGWTLNGNGLYQVMTDYLLLRDYDLGRHVNLVKTIIERFSHAFFEEEELDRLEVAMNNKAEDAAAKSIAVQRVNQTIKPFCYFTASIWQGLQEDENPLSPKDAYWLGAVDEVYDSNLPCLREVAESDSPEEPELPASQK